MLPRPHLEEATINPYKIGGVFHSIRKQMSLQSLFDIIHRLLNNSNLMKMRMVIIAIAHPRNAPTKTSVGKCTPK